MQGNGFHVLTGAILVAVVVTAMVMPKKGAGDVAQEPDKYAQNQPADAAEDISDLRLPTMEPRMELEDEMPEAEESNSEEVEVSQPVVEIEIEEKEAEAEVEEEDEEEIVSETFSSTTAAREEVFHSDDDLFTWPVDENIIYEYSDNDVGSSFMNPTLERTMRSFGLFLKSEDQAKVAVAGQGKVLSVTQYPTADIPAKMDYPQVGTAVIVDHGNDWKTVYGLHTGKASVSPGDFVEAGDIVGTIGAPSKDFSLTGSNLYFQILKNDQPVNPKDMLK